METYYTDNQTYVGADQAAIRDIEASLASGAGATITPSGQSATEYVLTATSKTNNTFTITKAIDGHRDAILHPPEHQGRLPGQHQLVVDNHVYRVEAGLRARLFVVNGRVRLSVQ